MATTTNPDALPGIARARIETMSGEEAREALARLVGQLDSWALDREEAAAAAADRAVREGREAEQLYGAVADVARSPQQRMTASIEAGSAAMRAGINRAEAEAWRRAVRDARLLIEAVTR